MKAIVRDDYGSPDVLRLEEVPTPTPTRDELLVRVVSASVAKGDVEILRGTPAWVRMAGFGLLRPRQRILGYNFSGRVEAIGDAVTKFNTGDEVFGDVLHNGLGAFAEYLCVTEDAAIINKPEEMTHDDAASVPEAGCIALQTLKQAGGIRPGDRVLINGGAGGAGSFFIQLAKSSGAEVTGIDRTEKLDLMRSLGADKVVDYTEADLSMLDDSYDLILDVVGIGPLRTWKRLLADGGTYLAAGGTISHIAKTLFYCLWSSVATSTKFGMLAVTPSKDKLKSTVELMMSGKVRATIEREYALLETASAIDCLGRGLSHGKLVISVSAP